MDSHRQRGRDVHPGGRLLHQEGVQQRAGPAVLARIRQHRPHRDEAHQGGCGVGDLGPVRLKLFAQVGARNITDYNARMKLQGSKRLPFLIVVIDELADLMMIAPGETEQTITRLAQLARATGIHMIIATQRPSVDVVTGLIKANFPARIAFRVQSKIDSRTILDGNGAEQLLGKGDMLYLPPASSRFVRQHGPYISEQESARLASFLRKQGKPIYNKSITEDDKKAGGSYLRVGFDPHGTWKTYRLRQDFYPAMKVQTEDDISASTVVPADWNAAASAGV